MFKVAIFLAIVYVLIDEGKACGGGGGGGGGDSGWSAGNGGISYTFENGVTVTGSGGISPPSATIGVSVPFKRKRRSSSDTNSNNEEKGEH